MTELENLEIWDLLPIVPPVVNINFGHWTYSYSAFITFVKQML